MRWWGTSMVNANASKFIFVLILSLFIGAVPKQETISTKAIPRLQLLRTNIAALIDDKEPAQVGAEFTTSVGRLYCFNDIRLEKYSFIDHSSLKVRIRHDWYKNGVLLSSVPLDIQSVNYRTFSFKNITDSISSLGDWKVNIYEILENSDDLSKTKMTLINTVRFKIIAKKQKA